MIEFIKPNELSHELLSKMYQASVRSESNVDICLLRSDYDQFELAINEVRQQKFDHVMKLDSTLDPTVLNVYATLSSASQLIVRGGINTHVANRATQAAAEIVNRSLDCSATLGTLSRMINCDATLYDHSASVAMLSSVIASSVIAKPLANRDTQIVAQCGLYHDAGKSCVPNHILNKPGSFTEDEYEVMKTHTVHGHEELEKAIEKGAPIDTITARVALEHHERFTGKGYPHGRLGRYEEDPVNGIHLYSRIVSIADVYSALLMKRVYKEAMDSNSAIELMKKIAPNDFDPHIFEPFYLRIQKSILDFHEKESMAEPSKITMIDEKESFTAAIRKTQTKK